MKKQMVILFFVVLIAAAYGCVCPRNYSPVCDNLGNEHSNMCLFECAAKKMLRSGIGIFLLKDVKKKLPNYLFLLFLFVFNYGFLFSELKVVKHGECSSPNDIPDREVFM